MKVCSKSLSTFSQLERDWHSQFVHTLCSSKKKKRKKRGGKSRDRVSRMNDGKAKFLDPELNRLNRLVIKLDDYTWRARSWIGGRRV